MRYGRVCSPDGIALNGGYAMAFASRAKKSECLIIMLSDELVKQPSRPPLAQQKQEIPMAKKEKMLEDLFHETLKDIYYAEKKILTALPKMAESCPVGRAKSCLHEARR